MATRTVRLDDDTEKTLQQVRETTGLPISEALKQGLHALHQRVRHETVRSPYDVYRDLDLGPGGYAIAPSTETRRGVRLALEKKLRRVILVDTGPLIALFDSKDGEHRRCVQALKPIRERLYTTLPVLTEAFHILQPDSVGSDRLRDFIVNGGLSIWFFDQAAVVRAFELMEQYADHPMDLADASLVTAAESLGTRTIFTIDRRDFATYRIRRGHRRYPPELIP